MLPFMLNKDVYKLQTSSSLHYYSFFNILNMVILFIQIHTTETYISLRTASCLRFLTHQSMLQIRRVSVDIVSYK